MPKYLTPQQRSSRRKLADKFAKEYRDADFACHVCQRPIIGRRGVLKSKKSYSGKSQYRKWLLCQSCSLLIESYIEELEVTLNKQRLDPEDLGPKNEILPARNEE